MQALGNVQKQAEKAEKDLKDIGDPNDHKVEILVQAFEMLDEGESKTEEKKGEEDKDTKQEPFKTFMGSFTPKPTIRKLSSSHGRSQPLTIGVIPFEHLLDLWWRKLWEINFSKNAQASDYWKDRRSRTK